MKLKAFLLFTLISAALNLNAMDRNTESDEIVCSSSEEELVNAVQDMQLDESIVETQSILLVLPYEVFIKIFELIVIEKLTYFPTITNADWSGLKNYNSIKLSERIHKCVKKQSASISLILRNYATVCKQFKLTLANCARSISIDCVSKVLRDALAVQRISLCDIVDSDGWTSLYWATPLKDNTRVIVMLYAADDAQKLVLQQANDFHCTPLHAASRWCHTKNALLFLKIAGDCAGKLLMIQNKAGETALMRAQFEGQPDKPNFQAFDEIIAFLQNAHAAYGPDENNDRLLEFLNKN